MHYIMKLNFGDTILYSVRYVGEGSRFELVNGRLFFEDKDELTSCLRLQGITAASSNEHFIDFDEILTWCDNSSMQVDCCKIYNCWSVASDMSDCKNQSLNVSPTTREVHHKLFLGSRFKMSPHTCNTHKVHWTDKEVKYLKQTIKKSILSIFKDTPYSLQKPKTVKKTLHIPENMFLKLTAYAKNHGLTFNELIIKSLNDIAKE